MARKNVWRGAVTSTKRTILFLMGGCIFLAIVCALTLTAFGLTILSEMSQVWDKLKKYIERKANHG
jgi:hypothetical protein